MFVRRDAHLTSFTGIAAPPSDWCSCIPLHQDRPADPTQRADLFSINKVTIHMQARRNHSPKTHLVGSSSSSGGDDDGDHTNSFSFGSLLVLVLYLCRFVAARTFHVVACVACLCLVAVCQMERAHQTAKRAPNRIGKNIHAARILRIGHGDARFSRSLYYRNAKSFSTKIKIRAGDAPTAKSVCVTQ